MQSYRLTDLVLLGRVRTRIDTQGLGRSTGSSCRPDDALQAGYTAELSTTENQRIRGIGNYELELAVSVRT